MGSTWGVLVPRLPERHSPLLVDSYSTNLNSNTRCPTKDQRRQRSLAQTSSPCSPRSRSRSSRRPLASSTTTRIRPDSVPLQRSDGQHSDSDQERALSNPDRQGPADGGN